MGFNKNKWNNIYKKRIEREERRRYLGDDSIQFEDVDNRKIKISPADGLQVEDSEGTIIHDTPDCVIASNMKYGGHIYFNTYNVGVIGSITVTQATEETSTSYTSTAQTNDITDYLPSDVTNAKAILANVHNQVSLLGTKVSSGSDIRSNVRYSLTYNTTSDNANYISGIRTKSQSIEGDDLELFAEQVTHAIIPITYNGDTPYITWDVVGDWSGLTTKNNYCGLEISIWLIGFLA